MKRALLENLEGDRATLKREELHHLVTVRRTRPGDLFEGIFEGKSRLRCRLEKDEKGQWFGKVLGSVAEDDESHLRVDLAPALIKKDKFEWVIQKAVELGVAKILPLLSHRTEVRLDPKRRGHKMYRWNRILAEAAKQSGRTRIPLLEEPAPLPDLLEDWSGGIKIALDEEASKGLRAVTRSVPNLSRCLIMVGPEGGWDDIERDLMIRHKVKRFKFGPRILRAETATVAALSVLQYEWGDLSLDSLEE